MTTLPPKGEKIVSDWLREHAAVSAIVGRRVVGKTPDDTDSPWVRATQFDGRPQGRPHHLLEFYFQFDCYAGKDGGQPEAQNLAAAVFAALSELSGANHQAEGATVTGCEPHLGLRRPDPDGFTAARERVIVTAYVYMHSNGES